jgi:leader peptidase (prepilin peptidase)/N-methyltransferase
VIGGVGAVGLFVDLALAVAAVGSSVFMPRLVGAFAPFEGEPVRRAVPPWWVFTAFTGLAAGLVTTVMWDRPWLPAYLYLTAAGVVLAVVDLRVHRLPDKIVIPSYPILAALFAESCLVTGDVRWDPHRWLAAGVAATLLFVLFGLLYLVRRSGLGLGDVKLVGLLGAALGWLGSLSLALAGLFLGLLSAGLYATVLLATRRARRTDPIAYGPHLLLGAYLAIVLGAAGHGGH